MRIWLFSAHASLEMAQVQSWIAQGIDVTGVFDVGSKQRPKVAGVTDMDGMPPEELIQRDRNLTTQSQDMDGIDAYVLHETVDRSKRCEHYARMGMPTFLQCFGQESVEEDETLVPLFLKYPNLHMVPYSLQIVDRYARLGVPHSQIHMIRFGVNIGEYLGSGWLGDLSILFCAHNSVHRRGEGCGWMQMREIFRILGTNFLFCGNETEKVGGLGELTFDALKMLYRRATIYLSMGTTPAPYTLTPIEAMASGCPVVFYDNGCGIMGEDWAQFALSGGGMISNDTQQIAEYVAKVLDNTIDPARLSNISLAVAAKYFDSAKNGALWKQMFQKVVL